MGMGPGLGLRLGNVAATGARTLIDPAYAVYADWYAAQGPQPPIYVLDSDTLFVPDPDE